MKLRNRVLVLLLVFLASFPVYFSVDWNRVSAHVLFNNIMSITPGFTEMSVEKLAQKLVANEENMQFIDVREPEEVEIAHLDRFEIYPLSQAAQWGDRIVSELDPEAETIVMCHHGIRSARMSQWLVDRGFRNVKNVAGGIDAYAIAIDASVPRY